MKKLLTVIGIFWVLGSSEVSADDGIFVKGGAAAAAAGAGSAVVLTTIWPVVLETVVFIAVVEGTNYVIKKVKDKLDKE